jgi:thiamine-phosphate pyrophosphorylase
MKPLDQCLLYTFIDTAYLHGRDVADVANQLCQGGSDLIQLRAKDRDADDVLRLAKKVSPIIQAAGVGLVINDYPQIAIEVGASFCHLGQEDFFGAGSGHIREVALGGSSVGIGLSSHAPEQAQRAITAGAAYVAIGPVYATPTKPGAPAAGLEYVRWAAEHVTIPWFAIGGINLERLDQVINAGARRICVVSAILNAPDVAEACQAFKERLISAGRPKNGSSKLKP